MKPPFGALPSAIKRKSRLPVRGCREEPERRVAARPASSGEKRYYRCPASIPLTPRRHAHQCSLMQQCRELIDIGGLPCSNIAFEQRSFLTAGQGGKHGGQTDSRSSSVARACCSALLTAAVDEFSRRAASDADHPRTSRSRRTARCRA